MDPESEHRRHGNSLVNILSGWSRQHDDNDSVKRNVLALNVLLLGDRQSGRSSVGNALIGGHEFKTGTCVSDVSVTTEFKVLRRTFPGYFRRQGAESDLLLRVIDTPPLRPESPQSVHELCPEGVQELCPRSVHELCPEGVHVVALVVRADAPQDTAYVERCAESLFGPDWRHHALIVLTHADHLKKAGLNPPGYQTEAADWPGALSSKMVGVVLRLDGNSCDWPSISGRPLRDRLLDLSARNHHRALKVCTEASL